METTLQLSEDILAGWTQDETPIPYAEIKVVRWEEDKEIPVLAVIAVKSSQVKMLPLRWFDESYKESEAVKALTEQAQRELIMFLLFN